MSETAWIEEDLFNKIRMVIPIPCVDLLVVCDKKLLLMLRNNEPGRDEWFSPGGRVLKGESLDEAVERVLAKETGLVAKDIQQMGTMTHLWPSVQTITTFYRVDVDNLDVTMNDEHRAYNWISGVDDELHPFIKEMLQKARLRGLNI